MVKRTKLFIINFKTYKQATGPKALKLTQICKKISKKTKQKIMIAVQATDISLVSKLKIPVLAQHTDYFEQGRNTGKVLPEAIKQVGAIGTLINHSENPLSLKIIEKTIKRCKDINLLTLVCVSNIKKTDQILKLKPNIIAYEVPELVASGKSITQIKPDSVKKFAKLVQKYNKKHKTKIKPLCGAGISKVKDVRTALKLGCEGVLVASAFVKSKNPSKILKEMIK